VKGGYFLGSWLFSCLWLLPCLPVGACLWDSDTLAEEKARFPDTQEMLAGNFPRHSKEFHEWRKLRCETLLKERPSDAALYDDLAVSQHKLGDHKGAIATMIAKEKVKPGLYETYSNLGTFYIYTGDLQEALKWIDKALEIKSDAHFGRERYQRLLVEWVLARDHESDADHPSSPNFAAYVLFKESRKTKPEPGDRETIRREALKGVMGMMRFADFDNPLLQEAAGDVLGFGELKENAAHLAHQAYLNASMKGTKDDRSRIAAKISVLEESNENLKGDPTRLKEERQKGAALAAQVREDERTWIKAGKDAAMEFDGKYRKRDS